MRFKRIYGKMTPVEHVKTATILGVEVEFFKYLYKGKDPVYYSFEMNEHNRGICISIESLASCMDITRLIIRDRDKSPKIIKKPKKIGVFELLILKVI